MKQTPARVTPERISAWVQSARPGDLALYAVHRPSPTTRQEWRELAARGLVRLHRKRIKAGVAYLAVRTEGQG